NTNSEGIAVLSDIPVYDKDNKKITYTISEKNVPVKYVVPANQKVTLTADATTEKTFKNVLKKFTAEVIKKDSEYETSQGDGSLAGAVYGLYLDGELVDTYTTDENGYFKTKEYVCGDNWTVKEITPSEGYLLDDTIYSVGAEAKNYTVEKNTVKMTVKEVIIKGKISIVKHSDDGTTQIETPEEGAEFKVYLKSAGSYENAKDSEKDHLVCDENGFAETKLLPYGVYAVHQTKGWENTEWMQDFEVVISENEKNYFYLINDAVLKSFVKIVKKYAETGKTICASGIGFKVWDCANERYIEQKVNYPSEMVLDTFYTDESGTLMLPCELVYGNYELHEVQTANGYVLDETPVSFTVDGKDEVITVEKFNTVQKGKISVQKTGDIFSRVQRTSSAYTDENGNLIENPRT
ncbi:MAG: TonB-dependent receptor, partial [Oscillospiraceae bacterium]|nr:TonB-dependent receptor [Oscillospiraceae bacterium]